MKLRDWLAEYRGRLTIRQFAAAVGAKEPTVYNWMAGTNVPRPKAMAAIVRVTGGAVQPSDFYEHGQAA